MRRQKVQLFIYILVFAGFLNIPQSYAVKIIPLHKITPKYKQRLASPTKEPEYSQDAYLLQTTLEKSLPIEILNKKINPYTALFLENDILQQPKTPDKKSLSLLFEFLALVHAFQTPSSYHEN